jgi:hypothetical protein
MGNQIEVRCLTASLLADGRSYLYKWIYGAWGIPLKTGTVQNVAQELESLEQVVWADMVICIYFNVNPFPAYLA